MYLVVQECRVTLLQHGGLPKLLSALGRALAPIQQAAAAREGQAASASAPGEPAVATVSDASFPLAAEDLTSLLVSLEQLAQAQSSHPGLVRDLGAEARHFWHGHPCHLCWKATELCDARPIWSQQALLKTLPSMPLANPSQVNCMQIWWQQQCGGSGT